MTTEQKPRENRLQAIGKRRYSDHRQPIADHEWLDLKPFEEKGRDVLRSDPLSDGGYHDVAVRRQSVTALWLARPAPKPDLRLPKTIRPDGPGFFPLFCAAQWIATRGGTRNFEPTDAAIWDSAFRDLTARIASGHITVTGIKNGVRERIEGHLFASLRVDHPFLPTPLNMILSDEMYLSTCPYVEEDHWHKGFHDSLQLRADIGWGKLMVLKSDTARFWPVALDQANPNEAQVMPSGGSGRPTAMHLVIAEHRKRLDAGSAEEKVGAESKHLAKWLREAHPGAPALTSKTIRNKIASEHRRAMNRPK